MKSTITNNGNETIVTLEGRLDTTNASDFERQIADLYTITNPYIILECTKLEYISSSGLRIFLTLLKHVKKQKGEMILRNMNSDIKEVFDMTGFSNMFSIE